MMNQLFNTVYLVFLSLLISAPLGIGAGICLSEYTRGGKLSELIRMCIETLSSLPSIVVGLFGYLVFILMTGFKWNLLAGALAVSILCLPLITSTTCDAMMAGIACLVYGLQKGLLRMGAKRKAKRSSF